MKYIKLSCSIAWFLTVHHVYTDPRISLFFRDYPTATDTAEHFQKTIRYTFGCPKKFARAQMESVVCRNLKAGIWGTYAGFLELSDADGQLSFPRKHPDAIIHVVITPQITPIIMFEQTVHHWELTPGIDHAIYQYEQHQDDETRRLYWQVTKIDQLAHNIIPADAVVLLAKPAHLYVPEGITLTQESPNLLLPTIYVKRGFNLASNTLYLLNINHLFNHARMKEKTDATRFTSQVVG